MIDVGVMVDDVVNPLCKEDVGLLPLPKEMGTCTWATLLYTFIAVIVVPDEFLQLKRTDSFGTFEIMFNPEDV
jgi:hypothetical protein